MHIKSKIFLPEGYEIQDTNEPFDVEIELIIGQPDQRLEAVYQMEEGELRFHVPDVAVYGISGGSRIRVTPYPEADEARVRLYLLGTCMGVLLLQRGILPLHGSAVVIGGKAYAIVGESGAGKSTLAAAFAHRGYPLMTDDVIAVYLSGGSGAPTVYPSYPQQKLWEESIEQLGMEAGGYESLYRRVNKYAVPVRSRFYREPLPLAGVLELTKSPEQEPAIDALHSLESLHILNIHTYRNTLLPLLDLTEWHFQTIAKLASLLPVYRLRRSESGFSAFHLVDRIVNL